MGAQQVYPHVLSEGKKLRICTVVTLKESFIPGPNIDMRRMLGKENLMNSVKNCGEEKCECCRNQIDFSKCHRL